MAKTHNYDSVLGKPIPSARVPWFVILCLIAAIVLVYLGFLRSPAKLLGPPIPRNEYLHVQKEVPPPAAQPGLTIQPAPTAIPPTAPHANPTDDGEGTNEQ